MAKQKSTKQSFHQTEHQHAETRVPSSLLNLKDPRDVVLKGQTITQHGYIQDLQQGDEPYLLAYGPAGTGKTYPAVVHAVKEFFAGNIKRIVMTRPMVGADEEEVGALPGGIIDKVAPWMLPILDILKEFYSTNDLRVLLERETIEIAPLTFMRGRTFKDVFLIADEMQNATPAQMKMLLTRLGEGSRFAITGDIEQTDRKKADNGLLDLVNRLEGKGNADFAITRFLEKDVVRHRAIKPVLKMYA